jgi:hypothetical protein
MEGDRWCASLSMPLIPHPVLPSVSQAADQLITQAHLLCSGSKGERQGVGGAEARLLLCCSTSQGKSRLFDISHAVNV